MINVLVWRMSNILGVDVMYIMNMWRVLDHTKYNFHFITIGDPLSLYYNIPDVEGHEILFPLEARSNRDLLRSLFSETLKKGNYDIVHLNTDAWSGFLLEELACEYKIPKIVIHAHCTGLDLEIESQRIRQERHFGWREKLTKELATDFCACSKKAAEWLYGDRISPDCIKILHNAIDSKKFHFSEEIRQRIRNEKNLKNKFVIGLVANFVPAKNHVFLVSILAEVVKHIPNAILWLVGSGNLQGQIQELACRLKIADNIIYEGASTEVASLLQAMDVFCMPSNREGLPIALIEAQASGLKCLISENISEEACIADCAKRLPLDINIWVNEILELSKGYIRKNRFDDILEAGYDLSVAVKELEAVYNS